MDTDDRTGGDGMRLGGVRLSNEEGTCAIGEVTNFDPDVLAGLEGVGVDIDREMGRDGDVPGVD